MLQVKTESDQTAETIKIAYELGADATEIKNPGSHWPLLFSKEKPQSIETFAERPYRTRRHEKFIDVESFEAYYNKFELTDSVLVFGSIKEANVKAIFDYPHEDKTDWCEHIGELVSVRTPEWSAWRDIANSYEMLNQIEFAEFIEKWNYTVISPDAAKVSEIALNMEGSEGKTFKSQINRTDGSGVFQYTVDTAVQTLRVPTHLKVSLMPFYSSELVELNVLLRFRIRDGAPHFAVVIQNMERVEYEALQSTFEKVTQLTGQKVLVGP